MFDVLMVQFCNVNDKNKWTLLKLISLMFFDHLLNVSSALDLSQTVDFSGTLLNGATPTQLSFSH